MVEHRKQLILAGSSSREHRMSQSKIRNANDDAGLLWLSIGALSVSAVLTVCKYRETV